MSQSAGTYLASLPEVETVRLPLHTLFYANGHIYEVVEVSTTGYSKARQWRRDESTDVALVPNSFLTKRLPLVKMGRILPVYRRRTELLEGGKEDGQLRGFIFPTETLAKDAAYLDVALIISAGAYVRNHNQEPAFAVTDGAQIYRLYYFMRSLHDHDTYFAGNFVENPHCELRPHSEGPMYWRLLPSWQDNMPASRVTQAAPSVKAGPSLPVIPDTPAAPDGNTTQVTRAVRRPAPPPTQEAPAIDPDATVVSGAPYRDSDGGGSQHGDETSPMQLYHPGDPE